MVVSEVPVTAHNVFCVDCGEFLFTSAYPMMVTAVCEDCALVPLGEKKRKWLERFPMFRGR